MTLPETWFGAAPVEARGQAARAADRLPTSASAAAGVASAAYTCASCQPAARSTGITG
jgi:hypothetical protein